MGNIEKDNNLTGDFGLYLKSEFNKECCMDGNIKFYDHAAISSVPLVIISSPCLHKCEK